MEIGFKEVNKNVYSGRLVGLWIKEVTREKMADALLAIAPHIEIIHATAYQLCFLFGNTPIVLRNQGHVSPWAPDLHYLPSINIRKAPILTYQ